ncbi:MAG: LysM peptidoglycan-binding domain-containing protein, partial [Bacteroidota bacterium]
MPKYAFLFTLSLVLFLNDISAQNRTHTVQKGENVYRISLKYGVSMQAIFDANPGSESVITSGQTLIIPNSSTNTNSSAQLSNGTYVVQRGETKYSLSKRFGVTIPQLEATNPQIVNGLLAGHVLNVPEGGQPYQPQPTVPDGPNTHKISTGETIWSISQSYGIRVQPLLDANPGIDMNDLQVGQNLRLPEVSDTESSAAETYVVQAGDTKFSLSQKFNLTIAELEFLNPEIVDGLNKGRVIRISGDTSKMIIQEARPTTAKASEATDGYVDYVIQPKETLYGLARKAGMTITEFVSLNPQLETEVLIGTVIKMPVNPINPDLAVITEEPKSEVKAINKTVEPTAVLNGDNSLLNSVDLSLSKKVVWLLPNSLIDLTGDPSGGKEALEQYRGGHIAIDKLKEQGFNIEESIIDVSSKSRKELGLSLSATDLILVSKGTGSALNNVSLNEKVVILNLSSQPMTNDAVTLNPITTFDNQTEAIFKLINDKNGNVIVINDAKRSRDKAIIDKYSPNAGFVKVKANDSFDETDLVQFLKASKLNIVIINSNKSSVFLNAT